MAALTAPQWAPADGVAPVAELPTLTIVTFTVEARDGYDGVAIEYRLPETRLRFRPTAADPPITEEERVGSSPEPEPLTRGPQALRDRFSGMSGTHEMRRCIQIDRDQGRPAIERIDVKVCDIRGNDDDWVGENYKDNSAMLYFEVS